VVRVKPHELAQRGEDAAAAFLERRGHTIVDRNWSCAAGEMDIVSLEGEAIVFTEVKTRSGDAHGLPEEAVDSTKQEHLCALAELYLATAGIEDSAVRFDVVAIRHLGGDRALLRHHKNAFGEA
jgi:putative endonuclease